MRSLLKFLGALFIALLAMLAFRAIAFTIYTVPGEGLEPAFLRGDRVMVNRWSYGLRTGGEGLFAYGRILRQPVKRGDLVAVNDSTGIRIQERTYSGFADDNDSWACCVQRIGMETA